MKMGVEKGSMGDVAMPCASLIENDTTIAVAGLSGNFGRNMILRQIASHFLESRDLTSSRARTLADNPIVGYDKAAAIAQLACRQNRLIIAGAVVEMDIPKAKLVALWAPQQPTLRGQPC